MKRFSMFAIGVCFVWLLLPAQAQANQTFVTGPLENAISLSDGTISKTVISKVLNNNCDYTVTALVKVYHLNGSKDLIDCATLTILPQSSQYHVSDVSGEYEYDVEIEVCGTDKVVDNTVVSVFGKDCHGKLVDAHRVLKSEMTVYKDGKDRKGKDGKHDDD